MIDLFAGHGGASAAMVERGWKVDRVELLPGYLVKPLWVTGEIVDHVADVRRWKWEGGAVDLLWASPPCTEFSRWLQPWFPRRPPSLGLVTAALDQVREIAPRWWVIENVKGAIGWLTPLLGPPVVRAAPVYLWGNLPPGMPPRLPTGYRKARISGRRPDLRAHVPWRVSAAVADAVEAALR